MQLLWYSPFNGLFHFLAQNILSLGHCSMKQFVALYGTLYIKTFCTNHCFSTQNICKFISFHSITWLEVFTSLYGKIHWNLMSQEKIKKSRLLTVDKKGQNIMWLWQSEVLSFLELWQYLRSYTVHAVFTINGVNDKKSAKFVSPTSKWSWHCTKLI